MSLSRIDTKDKSPLILPKLLLGLWLLFTATLFFGILALFFLLIPEIVRGTMFSDAGAVISLLILIVPSVCITLYGFVKGWYFSWLVAKLSYQMAGFLIGLAIVITIFNAPFNIVGAVVVAGQFALLKWAFVSNASLDSREFREKYSVIKYSHY